MYISDEKKADLTLEIWREIMRAKGEYMGGYTLGGGGPGHYTPAPDPEECAKKAKATLGAMFPTEPKKPVKRRR